MANNIIVNNGFDKDYMAVYRALSDRELREGLKQQADLDPGFRDLMRMMDDPTYVRLSSDAREAAKGLCPGMVMPKNLGDRILRFREYASVRYPEGWKLIQEYEHAAGCIVKAEDSLSVTANAVVIPYTGSYVSPYAVVVVSPGPIILTSPIALILGTM